MYYVIQRCRRCDTWIKREIALNNEKLEMTVRKFAVNHLDPSTEVHYETPIRANPRKPINPNDQA